MANKKFTNSLGDALGQFWVNYVGWGRATRSEYWWAFLFYNVLAWIVFSIVGGLLLSTCGYYDHECVSATLGIISLLQLIYWFAIMIPGFTVCARRLHDAGHSNWNICWAFLPIVGVIILLVYLCQPSVKKANKWGAPRI